MAIANVGDGGYNSASASGGTASVTLAFPAGIVAGNLVIAAVCAQFGGTTILTPTVTTPAGWTKLGSVVGNATTNTQTQLYLFGAIWSSGLTGVFAGASLGVGGMDGEIRGLSGTGSTVGTAFGNFTSIAVNSLAAVAIPGPSGFTSGQWNLWASINYSNNAQPTSSPVVSNIYYNAGAFEAFMIGTTAPGSAPGTETYTWASAGNWDGVGVTILPAAPVTFAQVGWWPNEARRRPVDKPQVWDSQQPLRNLGILVPTTMLPPPWFDPPKRWVAPPGFEPTWTRNYGILVPTNLPPQPWFDPPKRWVAPPGFDTTGGIPQVFGTPVKPSEPWFDPPHRWVAPPGFEAPPWRNLGTTVPVAKPSEPWFDPPKRWKAPPPFEVQAIPYLGIPVPTAAPQSEFWQAVKQPARQTIWNMDVLQPFAAAVVQPSFVSTDFWSTARRAYSTVSWDGNYIIPLAVITPVPSDWWTVSRSPYRALVWDSNQTPQFFGIPVPTAKPSEPWFDPPKRWVAPPGFEAPPWRNLGTTVPTTKPSEPWFDPPQRWLARQWFEVTWFQNYGIPVPTTKPSESWFDPPKRWNAPPGFEPHTLKPIIPGTPTPSSALPTPWFDPPKRWIAPPGFDPTYERPFGTQVPTSALPPEWWSALRRAPPVSTWSPDVLRPPVAAVVTPSFVSADFWAQARRQAAALSWDGVSPLSPSVSQPFIGADWWGAASGRRPQTNWDGIAPSPPSSPILIGSEWWTGAPNARRRAEWWDFIPLGSRLVPFMDQAWWGFKARAAGRADDWRFQSPPAPSVGVLEGWQTGFFDTRLPGRRSAQEWVLGPFFAFIGTPTFVPPLQIVNAPTQEPIVKGAPVSSVVYAIDIVSIVKK